MHMTSESHEGFSGDALFSDDNRYVRCQQKVRSVIVG